MFWKKFLIENSERTRPGLVIGTNAGRIILTLVRENMALTMDRDP